MFGEESSEVVEEASQAISAVKSALLTKNAASSAAKSDTASGANANASTKKK